MLIIDFVDSEGSYEPSLGQTNKWIWMHGINQYDIFEVKCQTMTLNTLYESRTPQTVLVYNLDLGNLWL